VYGFVSGAMHEAATLPVLVGICAFLAAKYVRHRKNCFGKASVVLLAGFGAGVVWCVLSPGILLRVAEDVAPDDSPVMLVIKSCPVVLVLFVAVSALMWVPSGRRNLTKLAGSAWIVFAVGAVVSACICAVGGIVGRSGWFAEVYALVAIWQLVALYRLRAARSLCFVGSCVLCVALLVHYAGYAWWQLKEGIQFRKVRELYLQSSDGVVCFENIEYEDIRPWWLLAKTRGVPDADDSYQLERFDHYYSRGAKNLVVIPLSEDKFDGLSGAFPLRLDGGYVISDRFPDGMTAKVHINERERSKVIILSDTLGKEYVATSFRHRRGMMYLISPRIVDPGDR
ncbi:MAG: hypothetical protein K2O12_01480, partial [Muribaculaceae bacterium]|nr:hypothetical protein [Muribaculaceae bacterium]